MTMNVYARKIANSTKFFVAGEWVDASSDTLNGIISLLVDDYSSGSDIGNDPVALDSMASNSNRDRADASLRLPNRSRNGDFQDRTLNRLPSPPFLQTGRGMLGPDPERHSGDFADGCSKASGRAGPRDPVSVYRTEMLCRLLEPIRPAAWGGRPVLWPLWADEMVHRTYVTIHLTALLMSNLRLEHNGPMRFELDYRVASNLAAAIGQLVIARDNERLPCSAVLRGIVRNLVELFGPVAGGIRIATRIEPLQLAAFKRRALALVAVELISQALASAYRRLDEGHIDVHLARISRSRARLTVKHSGRNQPACVPQACQPIGQDLASLLEAEIVYGIPALDGTTAQIDFLI
jgi:two-component sensor histidine kinase